jgi:hypothetical protein
VRVMVDRGRRRRRVCRSGRRGGGAGIPFVFVVVIFVIVDSYSSYFCNDRRFPGWNCLQVVHAVKPNSQSTLISVASSNQRALEPKMIPSRQRESVLDFT